MRALFDWIIAAFLLACSLSALAALFAVWRAVKTDWSEDPPLHARRGRTAVVIGAGWLAAAGALVETSPWGPATPLYVVGLGGVTAMVGVFLVLSWETLADIHRARVAARAAPRPRWRPRLH